MDKEKAGTNITDALTEVYCIAEALKEDVEEAPEYFSDGFDVEVIHCCKRIMDKCNIFLHINNNEDD